MTIVINVYKKICTSLYKRKFFDILKWLQSLSFLAAIKNKNLPSNFLYILALENDIKTTIAMSKKIKSRVK